jgi:hypothetical protein
MIQQTKLFQHFKGRSLSFSECARLYMTLKKHGGKIVYKSIRKTG